MNERTLAPGLLVAMPQLPDPNFNRSVVLMIEHSEESSLGLIVNRPATLLVSEVLEQLEIEWAGIEDAVVWQGGPVEPYRGCVLHAPVPVAADDAPIEVVPGISLSTTADQLRELAGRPPASFRFLLGYSGWGEGQLEREMAEGAWLLAPATADLVFGTPPDQMWEAAISSLGIDPATLVPAGGIH